MNDCYGGNLHGQKKLFERSKERAFACLNDQEYSRAFAHLIVAITIKPDVDDELLNVFLYILEQLAAEHEVKKNWNELLMVYEEALGVLPYNAHVLHSLATLLFRLGHVESATSYFQRAYKENPNFTPSLYCMDNIKCLLVERWHFMMLNDIERNKAYSQAINTAVKCGYKHVLDIGAGTGILSMMAADAGAEMVYACEGSQIMFRIMQSIIKENSKSIQILEKFSYDIKLPVDMPNKVPLIITEIFDAGLFGEHVLYTLKHAWEHLIESDSIKNRKDVSNVKNNDINVNSKSDTENSVSTESAVQQISSKVIPQSAEVWAVPIECERIRYYGRVNEECLKLFGIPEASITTSLSVDSPYTTEKLSDLPGGFKYFSSPQCILKVNFCSLEEICALLNGKTISSNFRCSVDGQLDAVAVWFVLHLDDQICISSQPENIAGCWEQALFCVTSRNLRGSSQMLQVNSEIQITFLCKGHLTLQRVITSVTDKSGDKKCECLLDCTVIYEINALYSCGVLSTDLCPLDCAITDCIIIDISTIPLLGLKLIKDGAKKLAVVHSKYQRSVDEFQKLLNTPKEKVSVLFYEELLQGSKEFNLLIIDPVETSGLLKQNIFEDVALLRRLHVGSSLKVIPGFVAIYCVLIDSPALFKQSKVISDESCAGYKISQFINVFQSNIHQDIQLSTLKHEKLSSVIKICEININDISLENNSFVEMCGNTEIIVEKSGNITAVPYWFVLEYSKECIVDTSKAKNLIKQAASIPGKDLTVTTGDKIKLQWTCRNSCLHITVEKQ